MSVISMTSRRVSTGGRQLLSYEERRRLRRVYDMARRDELAKGSSDRYELASLRMTLRQKNLAYQSLLDGLTIEEIAAAIWGQYGFSSQSACLHVLQHHFESLAIIEGAA